MQRKKAKFLHLKNPSLSERILQILNENPDLELYPIDLTDEVNRIRMPGEHKVVPNTVRSSARRLVEQGLLSKVYRDNNVFFRSLQYGNILEPSSLFFEVPEDQPQTQSIIDYQVPLVDEIDSLINKRLEELIKLEVFRNELIIKESKDVQTT